MKKATFTLCVVTLLLLHQDIWFWTTPRPLLFGFLPPGLWYHILFCLAASALMAALVRWAWPEDPDSSSSGQEPRA